MICAIMQPTYLPWLGYFDLIRNADVFVVYDHVQFEKRSWQQRNKILYNGHELLLTVPIISSSRYFQQINEVEIDKTHKFVFKHINSIKSAYKNSKNFAIIFDELNSIYSRNHTFLIDLNIDLIKLGMKHLSIEKDFIYSSRLDVKGRKVDALIDICKKLNADKYLSPVGSKVYIDQNNLFPEYGIELKYQEFDHPVYKQLNSNEFISHLSFIDYLFNVDVKEVLKFKIL